MILHDGLQLCSAGVMRKKTPSFLIGVEYEIKVSTKNNITASFFIYVYFEGSPTLLFVSIVYWYIDVVDDNPLVIC